MPSPFPGMDPYLEVSSLWPDVHHELISEIRSALNSQVFPKYIACIETRIYITHETKPRRRSVVADMSIEKPASAKPAKITNRGTIALIDEPIIVPYPLLDEVEEARVEIKDRETDDLVSVIEILSPTNKTPGTEGRESFENKRREIFASNAHWVEIDLLRAGLPFTETFLPRSDYRIFVSRGDDRRNMRCWPISVRDKLPVIGIPLKDKDPDAALDLGRILTASYDEAHYESRIDYAKPPRPPLSPADAKWANKLLREKGMRR